MENRFSRRRLFVLALIPWIGARAETRKQRKARCERIRQRIRRLDSKLRAGHSGSAGRRWREKRRALQLQRHRQCR